MKIVNAECIALDVPFYADHGTRHIHRANTHAERVHVYRLEADKGRVGYGDGHREWRFTDEKVYQFAFYKGNFPAFRRGSI